MTRRTRGPCFILIPVFAALPAVQARAEMLGGGAADPGVSVVRVVLALLLCLALAVAGAFAIRYRLGLPGGLQLLARPRSRRLRLIENLRVSPQVQLCIVACDEDELLLSATPNGAQLLRCLRVTEPRDGRTGDGPS